MAEKGFVHLHVHSEYSTLDGACRLDALCAKTAKCKMSAVALTDHGNLYGAVDFFLAAKKQGIKPIFGCEGYLAPGDMTERKAVPGRRPSTHLTVLAENNTGYHNLVKLISRAHHEGFYYKPRFDKAALAEHSEGLIVLSGCLVGEVNQFIVNDQIDEARKSIGEFVEIFGPDHFFLEIHDHGLESQHKCTEQMVEFAREFDLKLVAANDVHFLNKNDHEAHDVMICIGTGAQVHDEKRLHYPTEVYFKTAKEMRQLFKELPEACDTTLEIAERCEVELDLDATSSAKYPSFDPPSGVSREEYFRDLCYKGLEERYGEERAKSDQTLIDRLEYEIGIMLRMGFESYFLITWDFIRWAREHKIPVGPGRGSAAGSLVAYCLRITDLCPLEFGLIFERFLNPERVSPPDVDIDFCQSRRGEVIDYVREKYGERAVSHIITFGTLGAKSVVRDVGRVMGMGYNETDRIAKMIPAELGITLKEARKKNPELATLIEGDGRTQQLWDYATFLEGLTRGTGIHAAGIVIGDRSLDEFIPLCRGNDGEVVTQYAMKPLTECGMLKMDFLGLKTLTVIQDAVEFIHAHHPDFVIESIPLDDPVTYKLLSDGDTIGVFQLESGGMVNLCRQFGVENLEDISALLALYRPGPMDLIPDFIARKKGKTKVRYEHPLLEDVASNTYGVLIYQEQVQKAANVLAGYSLGEADLLRRAMGKKDKKKMAVERDKFVKGCLEINKIPAKKANAIFDILEKFAGYGFNKSHSAAYGLITYQTAYLKANFPVEFMAAVLSNEINNTDKIAIFISECRNMGIDILPPDVNRSQLKFTPEIRDGVVRNGLDGAGRAIRYGLAAIKNVGGHAMEQAIAERAKNGGFASLEDFAVRLDSKTVNRKILESLIRCGAFDFTEESRWDLHARIERVVASSAAASRDRQAGQGSLFDTMELTVAQPVAGPAAAEEATAWSKQETLAFEKDLLGFYVTGHPLDPFRNTIKSKPKVKSLLAIDQLKTGRGNIFQFAGMVIDASIRYTKRDSKPFAILHFEDLDRHVEMMVWNDVYSKIDTQLLESGSVIHLKGYVEVDDRTETRRLVATDMRKLKIDPDAKPLPKRHNAVTLFLSQNEHSLEDLSYIKEQIKELPGNSPLYFAIRDKNNHTVMLRAGDKFMVHDGPVLRRVLELWLGDPAEASSGKTEQSEAG